MMKPDSLYNSGMKPLLYSEGIAKHKSKRMKKVIKPAFIEIGWHRDGYDICYYQNNMKRRNAGYYYTLTFAVKFKCILFPLFSSLIFLKMISILFTLLIAIHIHTQIFAVLYELSRMILSRNRTLEENYYARLLLETSKSFHLNQS